MTLPATWQTVSSNSYTTNVVSCSSGFIAKAVVLLRALSLCDLHLLAGVYVSLLTCLFFFLPLVSRPRLSLSVHLCLCPAISRPLSWPFLRFFFSLSHSRCPSSCCSLHFSRLAQVHVSKELQERIHVCGAILHIFCCLALTLAERHGTVRVHPQH